MRSKGSGLGLWGWGELRDGYRQYEMSLVKFVFSIFSREVNFLTFKILRFLEKLFFKKFD